MKNLSRTNFRATTALLIAASLATSIATPRPANAVIGLVTGNLIMSVVGGGLAAAGGLAHAFDLGNANGWSDDNVQDVAMLSLIFGLIILDANNQVTPSYSAVTPTQASGLGMTDSEEQAFNSELDQINLVSQSIMAETMKENQPKTSATALETSIQSQWANAQDSISAEAFSGLQKVQRAISASLQTQAK